MRDRTWIRGALALGLLGALTAGLMLSPATAAKRFATRKFVNKKVSALRGSLGGFEVVKTSAEGISGGNHDGFYDLDAPGSLLLALPLPAGGYIITSTFTLFNKDVFMVCELRAGSERDQYGSFDFEPGAEQERVAMSLAHTFTEAGQAELRCDDSTAATDDSALDQIRITAVEVPTLTETTSP
jgi:hypothetical protein